MKKILTIVLFLLPVFLYVSCDNSFNYIPSNNYNSNLHNENSDDENENYSHNENDPLYDWNNTNGGKERPHNYHRR